MQGEVWIFSGDMRLLDVDMPPFTLGGVWVSTLSGAVLSILSGGVGAPLGDGFAMIALSCQMARAWRILYCVAGGRTA